MASLIEELPARIAELEAKHGSADPFVKDLKEQLRAMKANVGKSAQDVFVAGAVPRDSAASDKRSEPPPVKDGAYSEEDLPDLQKRWPGITLAEANAVARTGGA